MRALGSRSGRRKTVNLISGLIIACMICIMHCRRSNGCISMRSRSRSRRFGFGAGRRALLQRRSYNEFYNISTSVTGARGAPLSTVRSRGEAAALRGGGVLECAPAGRGLGESEGDCLCVAGRFVCPRAWRAACGVRARRACRVRPSRPARWRGAARGTGSAKARSRLRATDCAARCARGERAADLLRLVLAPPHANVRRVPVRAFRRKSNARLPADAPAAGTSDI